MSVNTYIIKGKAWYAKILGKAPPGYDGGANEWSIDVQPDAEGLAKLKELGASFYVKDKAHGKVVTFKRKAIKADGEPAKPYQVVDAQNRPWDASKLIGNGSEVNVCFTINEVGKGKEKRNKPSMLSLQVWEHIPYQPKSPFDSKPGETQPEGTTW